MKVTEVIKTDAQWSRDAYLNLVDDKVVFDCSNEEYGPIEFPIHLIEEAIVKHRKKIEHEDWINRLFKFRK